MSELAADEVARKQYTNTRYIFLHRFLSKALMYRFPEFGRIGEDTSLDPFYVVILTSSCSGTHSSDTSLLPSCTRRRHFLSKAFVCCFLVFCRTGEYISLHLFYLGTGMLRFYVQRTAEGVTR